MPLNLTELLLLMIVIAGAVYAGYLLGRWSVLKELDRPGMPTPTSSPLPGPQNDAREPPPHDGGDYADAGSMPRRSSAPPPASAGGPQAGTGTTLPRRSAAPPPASAGPAQGDPSAGSGEPRRTAAPPPARAGLMDTGAGTPAAPPGKSGPVGGKSTKRRG